MIVTRRTRVLFLFSAVTALLLAMASCGKRKAALHEARLFVLGTLVEVTIWGADEKLAQRAISAVEADLGEVHYTWHAWQPGLLTRINSRFAAGQPVSPGSAAVELIARAARLARASNQLFNPAIGGLIGLWGFHSDDRPDGPPPGPTAIKALLKEAPAMSDLIIAGQTVRSANPAVQLDFGGFAKGYAVDRAIEHLRRLGIRNAIVNAGGDLRAIGAHGARPWRIGIRNPKGPGVIASLAIRGDESVFTSGNYERFFDYQGTRYHHIIDPRTGYPATGSASVTVIYDNAATADAAATALFVAGPKLWRATARRMGVDQVMLIDNQGKVFMTSAMARRIHFEVKPPPPVDVSPS